MTWFIKIQVGIIVLCIAEAYLEEIVILLKDPSLPNYTSLNIKEHFRSALYYLAVVVLLILLSSEFSTRYSIIAFVTMIIERRIFFETALKLFRKSKRIKDIEGDQFFDRMSRSIFGDHGGVQELLALLLVVFIMNVIVFKIGY